MIYGLIPETFLGTLNLTRTNEAANFFGNIDLSLIVNSTLYWLTVSKNAKTLKGALKSDVIL